jgi:glycosyltransferase involved in cell wall biosynthesis
MNILVLAWDYPVTTRMAGSSRLFNLCRQMSRRHRLTLAFFRRSKERDTAFFDDPDNRGVFQEFVTLPSPEDLGLPAPTWLNRQFHRLTSEPYFSLRRLAPKQLNKCRQIVSQLLAEKRIDLVYVDGASMVQHVPPNCSVPIVADFCDCGSLLIAQNARAERRAIRRLALQCEARGMARAEKNAAQLADVTIAISKHDEDGIRKSCPQANTMVMPNGIDSEYFAPRTTTQAGPGTGRLIFTGVMRYPPNAEAAAFFAREVFPLVRKKWPAAEFWIVGADPPPSLTELSDVPGIKITGTVDDVRPYLYESDVFVCPLRNGTGVKNKLLAALAMKIPVVATQESLLGLNLVSGEHVLAAETPIEIAEQINLLLSDPLRAGGLAENGRMLIEQRYSWCTYGAMLERTLADVASNSRRSAVDKKGTLV